MRISNLALGIIALVSFLCAVVFWSQFRGEQQRAESLSMQLEDSSRRLALIQSRAEAATSNPIEMPLTRDVVQVPSESRVVTGRREAAQLDPVLHQALLAQLRLQIPKSYPDLASELGLTPDAASRLFDLLVIQEEDRRNVGERSRDANEAESIRSFAEINERQKSELLALLGSKYSQFEEYKSTQTPRQQVASFRVSQESIGTPLRTDQVRNLNQTMIAEFQRLEQEEQELFRSARLQNWQAPDHFEERRFKLRMESNARVLAGASAYLTEPQLLAFTKQLESRTIANNAGARKQSAGADKVDTDR